MLPALSAAVAFRGIVTAESLGTVRSEKGPNVAMYMSPDSIMVAFPGAGPAHSSVTDEIPDGSRAPTATDKVAGSLGGAHPPPAQMVVGETLRALMAGEEVSKGGIGLSE